MCVYILYNYIYLYVYVCGVIKLQIANVGNGRQARVRTTSKVSAETAKVNC